MYITSDIDLQDLLQQALSTHGRFRVLEVLAEVDGWKGGEEFAVAACRLLGGDEE
jgi:hypothetical protein